MQTALVAAVVTCGACYPVLHLLRRAGRLDVPNARSSHAVPTPRGGGLALLAGIAGAAFVTARVGPAWSTTAWVAVFASILLALLGLADDLVGLPAHPRLLAQAAVGLGSGLTLGGWQGALLGAIVVPAAVNMVNFMDGINGICAGHAIVWGTGALIASRYTGVDALAVLGALSLGCGLGFLPWNVPKARLFLGDVGSYLVGALAGTAVLVALTALLPWGDGPEAWPLLGLVCAPYLLFAVDTVTVLARRASRGEPLLRAHRQHVYQRLVRMPTCPHWAVSAGVAGLSALATWTATKGIIVCTVTLMTVTATYLSAPHWLGARVPS